MSDSESEDELRRQVQAAVDARGGRVVAAGADITPDTLYRFLNGANLRAGTRTKLSDALRRDAARGVTSTATSGQGAAGTQAIGTVGPATSGDATPSVSIPLHVLTYWRGRVEEQVNNVTSVARSLAALQGMLEQATAGMTEFVDSGVLPALERTPPPRAPETKKSRPGISMDELRGRDSRRDKAAEGGG